MGVDGYLYLGPRDVLLLEAIPAVIVMDTAYLEVLRDRARITEGPLGLDAILREASDASVFFNQSPGSAEPGEERASASPQVDVIAGRLAAVGLAVTREFEDEGQNHYYDAMKQGEDAVTARDAPVYITPYDRSWPALFEAERTLLTTILRPWLAGPVEHVGSTAVPGMPAKPVLDIMAGVGSLEASRDAAAVLQEHAYHYAPYRSDVMHWFCKPGISERTHHLHLIPFGSPLWHERLRFRNCLRSNRAVAEEYAALKYHLAELHRENREAYTQAKGAFIARVLSRSTRSPGREVSLASHLTSASSRRGRC